MTDASRERARCRRVRFLSGAEAFFDELTSDFTPLVGPFRIILSGYCLPSGRLVDFLAADDDFPALDLPFWLLDDLGKADECGWAEVQEPLMLAACWYAVGLIFDQILLDRGPFLDPEHFLVSQMLRREADRHLAKVVDPASIEEVITCAWRDREAAEIWYRRTHFRRVAPWSEGALHRLTHRQAPVRIAPAAALWRSGHGTRIPELLTLINEVASLFLGLHDLGAFRADLERRNFTPPIVRVMQEAGLPLNRIPDTGEVLGAMLSTEALPRLVDDNLVRAGSAERALRALGWPTFADQVAGLATRFAEFAAILSATRRLSVLVPKGVSTGNASPPPPLTTPMCGNPATIGTHALSTAAERLPKELATTGSTKDPCAVQALGFLTADPEYRECWETYRCGLFGLPQLTGRLFPMSLVALNLAAAGENVNELTGRIFEHYRASDRHYFAEPNPLPPDIDSLGSLLRLFRHAPDQAGAAHLLEPALGWMGANLGSDGYIPVWMTEGVTATTGREYLPKVTGGDCPACRANLLLGLLNYAPDRFADAIVRLGRHLFISLTRAGSPASWYPPVYLLGVLRDILAIMQNTSFAALLASEIKGAAEFLAAGLSRAIENPDPSPQTTALVILAGGANPDGGSWREFLRQSRRIFGGWEAEPIYHVPAVSDGVGWYSSRLVTSSFCYRALADRRGTRGGAGP